jgi:hypothetical protein
MLFLIQKLELYLQAVSSKPSKANRGILLLWTSFFYDPWLRLTLIMYKGRNKQPETLMIQV